MGHDGIKPVLGWVGGQEQQQFKELVYVGGCVYPQSAAEDALHTLWCAHSVKELFCYNWLCGKGT